MSGHPQPSITQFVVNKEDVPFLKSVKKIFVQSENTPSPVNTIYNEATKKRRGFLIIIPKSQDSWREKSGDELEVWISVLIFGSTVL